VLFHHYASSRLKEIDYNEAGKGKDHWIIQDVLIILLGKKRMQCKATGNGI
jgi:hypothetical protein